MMPKSLKSSIPIFWWKGPSSDSFFFRMVLKICGWMTLGRSSSWSWHSYPFRVMGVLVVKPGGETFKLLNSWCPPLPLPRGPKKTCPGLAFSQVVAIFEAALWRRQKWQEDLCPHHACGHDSRLDVLSQVFLGGPSTQSPCLIHQVIKTTGTCCHDFLSTWKPSKSRKVWDFLMFLLSVLSANLGRIFHMVAAIYWIYLTTVLWDETHSLLVSTLLGKIIQFDKYFWNELKPPPSACCRR